jgi:hypothetical protein
VFLDKRQADRCVRRLHGNVFVAKDLKRKIQGIPGGLTNVCLDETKGLPRTVQSAKDNSCKRQVVAFRFVQRKADGTKCQGINNTLKKIVAFTPLGNGMR